MSEVEAGQIVTDGKNVTINAPVASAAASSGPPPDTDSEQPKQETD